MRFGKRKIMAAGGLVAVTALAVAAWALWGTDGLLAVTLGALLFTTAALGWLVAESQRQLQSLLLTMQRTVVEAATAAAEPDDRAEQLLRAVHAGVARSDHTLDTLVSEWQRASEELLTAVEGSLERSRTTAGDRPVSDGKADQGDLSSS